MSAELPTKLPTNSTFSFKAPFPAESSASTSSPSVVKQRRVSLALPSSTPREVPAWSFRDDTGIESHVAESEMPQKRGKMRKIVGDDDQAPLPDKKPRKKWTMEETQMLVDGCNRHGVGNWKTILSDPTLQFDNRSPVDLKDRFRTYFPDAYKKHYPNARTHLSSKVRSTLPDGSSLFEKTRSKKRRPFTEEEDRALKEGYERHGTVWATIVKDPIFQEQNRKSTDLRDRFRNAYPELYQAAGYRPRKKLDTKDDSGATRRKRRHTSQGLLRGGTKSVPQSAAASEDEYSSGGEDVLNTSSGTISRPKRSQSMLAASTTAASTPLMHTIDDDMDIGLDPSLANLLPLSDFLGSQSDFISSSQSDIDVQSQTWSTSASGLDTPTHSSHNAWTGSPTSSFLSFDSRSTNGDRIGMIGKSAWSGDWLNANPRLGDPGFSSPSGGAGTFSPSSPFSFSHLNHGVMDRYDLVPASISHDFLSEAGVGDTHSTFSDEMFPPSGFRGFTHHSNYAGDLIFGARTHQPSPADSFGSMLGLSGMSSILHTPALPGIEELAVSDHEADISLPHAMEDVSITAKEDEQQLPFTLDDYVDLSQSQDLQHSTPPGTPVNQSRHLRHRSVNLNHHHAQYGSTSQQQRSISVPPTDARVPQPQKEAITAPRFTASRSHSESLLLGNGISTASMPPPSAFPPPANPISSQPAPQTQFLSFSDAAGQEYDLPFLDLHYYGHSGAEPSDPGQMGGMTGNEALDLAASRAPVTPNPNTTGVKGASAPVLAPPMRRVMSSGPAPMLSRSASVSRAQVQHHHRGQSAVCPQDLLLRSETNKRKRASWDGLQS